MKKRGKIISILFSIIFLIFAIFFTLVPKLSYTSVIKNFRTTSKIEIYGDVNFQQYFQSNISKIDFLSIPIAEYFDGILHYQLLKNDKLIFEKDYTFEDLENNSLKIDVEQIEVHSDDKFLMNITCSNCSMDNALKLSVASEINEKEISFLNEEKLEKAMHFSITGNKYNYTFAIVFSFLYVISFVSFCFFMMHGVAIKKIKLYFLLEFLLALCSGCFVYLCIISFQYEMYFNLYWFVLGLFSISIFIVVFVKLLKIAILKKEQIYLVLGIPIAVCYAIFMIPGFVADEPAHFWRAYNLLDDNIFSTDSAIKIPEHFLHYNMGVINDYSNLNASLAIKANYNDEVDYVTSANGYSFILYVFAEIGLVLGKIFSLPAMLTFYLARLFNTIGMLLFGYFIIKWIPFGKNVALIYLLNPMYIHQGVSVSADSMVNSICLLFIAILLNFRKKEKYEFHDYLLLGFITILMGFAKYIYIPLLLLFFLFLFPKNKNQNKIKKDKRNFYVICGSSLVAIILCCYYLFSLYLLPSAANASESMEGINMIGQLKYILLHPTYVIKTMHALFKYSLSGYIDMFFGMRLGWLDIYNIPFIIWIYEFMFFSSPFIETMEKNTFTCSEKIFCNLLVLFISFLAILSMWICWTPIGEVIIAGIQGRYFLPVILLLMLTFVNPTQKIKVQNYSYKLTFVMLLIHTIIIFNVVQYFI